MRAASVPLMGRIAAGVPISAIQNHTQDIAVPPEMVAGGEHFALEVKGNSMIDAGINEGDIIICERCDTAENGDIVVALVEKEEATLKRLRKKGASIALEAANPNYETRIFGPDQVDIQGRLVGLDPAVLTARRERGDRQKAVKIAYFSRDQERAPVSGSAAPS